jgi:hypothetical protein
VLTDVEQEGNLFSNTCSSFDSSISMGCDDVTPNVSHYELNSFFYGVAVHMCVTLFYGVTVQNLCNIALWCYCTQFVSHCFMVLMYKICVTLLYGVAVHNLCHIALWCYCTQFASHCLMVLLYTICVTLLYGVTVQNLCHIALWCYCTQFVSHCFTLN